MQSALGLKARSPVKVASGFVYTTVRTVLGDSFCGLDAEAACHGVVDNPLVGDMSKCAKKTSGGGDFVS